MAVNEGFHLGKFGHTYLTRFQSLQAKRVGIVKVNILYGSINRFLKATNRFTKEFKELRYKIRRYVDLHKNEQYQD